MKFCVSGRQMQLYAWLELDFKKEGLWITCLAKNSTTVFYPSTVETKSIHSLG